MKALTLTQPHASLIPLGAKRIETRSWSTNYRGRIAIHAAKGFPQKARALCQAHPFIEALNAFNLTEKDLPLGAVVATANLWRVQRIGTNDYPEEPEKSFGDYRAGRYAWFLDDIRAIEPVPCKGMLGLWEWDDS